jgi:ankyrin repeat protein
VTGGIVIQSWCAGQFLEVAKAAIDGGADVNYIYRNCGRSALHWAAACDHDELIRYMFEHGSADLNLRCPEDDNATPLHTALMYDHLDAAEVLVELGADVELEDDLGRRPIEMAAEDEELRAMMEQAGRQRRLAQTT